MAQTIVTGVVLVVMVAYAALVWRSRRFQLREDQSGDNLYYLGFLFTLVSLACALVEFTPDTGAEGIIGSFGIALATTIVGLALRVFFNQMRQDPVEIDREARLELAEAASRLRAELDSAVIDMNCFRRATQQSIAESLEMVANKAAEQMTANAEHVQSATSLLVKQMQAVLGDFAASAEKAIASTTNVAVGLEHLFSRLEKIEAPSDLIINKITPAAEAFRAIAAEARKRARSDERHLSALAKAVEGAAGGAEALTVRVQAAEMLAGHEPIDCRR